MEILHQPNDLQAISSQSSQDSPVDLTKNAIICPPSFLLHMTPLHPQIGSHHGKFPEDIVKSSEELHEKKFNEIKSNFSVKVETRFCEGLKGSSKRKHEVDDGHKIENTLVKRQKIDNGCPLAQINDAFHSNNNLPKNFGQTMESNYWPFKYQQQFLPLNNSVYAELLEKLKSHQSSTSASFIKETESLLAAVQHSQMLYYSYCSKLLQNLQTRKYIEEQERTYHFYNESTNKETASLPSITLQNAKKVSPKSRLNVSKKVPRIISKNNISSEKKNPNNAAEPISSPSSTTQKRNVGIKHKSTSEASSVKNRKSKFASDASQFSNEENTKLSSRKRAPRALTGKHVRHGTGASLSTLRTLRLKLQEKQRISQAHPVNIAK